MLKIKMRKIITDYFSGLSLRPFMLKVLQLRMDTFCPFRDNHESQFEAERAQKSSKSSNSQSYFSPISPFGEGNVDESDVPQAFPSVKNELANLLLLLLPDQSFNVGCERGYVDCFPLDTLKSVNS
jgi:hypothetical protein